MKWNTCSLVKMMELTDVSIVLTDEGLPREARGRIRGAGIELLIV